MKKEKQMLIRVSEAEKKDFEAAAEISGIGFSAWARQKLRNAAIIDLQTIGKSPSFLDNTKV